MKNKKPTHEISLAGHTPPNRKTHSRLIASQCALWLWCRERGIPMPRRSNP